MLCSETSHNAAGPALTLLLSGCYYQELGKLPSGKRPRRLAWPRTSPFHGGNTGSNPVGDAKFIKRLLICSIQHIQR